MNYATACSGIEAPAVAWNAMGWKQQFCSEIDPFCCALLELRHPDVPNLGCMEAIDAERYRGSVDVICAGTPCQSFSLAGLRKGMDDPRGNLTIGYLRLVDQVRPRWVVWENVPGVLSSNKGKDLGAFLAGLVELGYGWAYRVLDAQYFGVPQRRRRVFVVGCSSGSWRDPAAVLFERESLLGNPAPSREAGQGIARSVTSSTGGCSAKEQQHTFVEARSGQPLNPLGVIDPPDTAWCLQERDHKGSDSDTKDGHLLPMVTHSLTSRYDSSEDGSNRGLPLVPDVAGPVQAQGEDGRGHRVDAEGAATGHLIPDVADPITANEGKTYTHEGKNNFRMHNTVIDTLDSHEGDKWGPEQWMNQNKAIVDDEPVQVQWASGGGKLENPTMQALRADAEHNYQFVRRGMGVRRLTPVECERLQGFPDNYTLIPYRGRTEDKCPDGPRYRALGNSMAVPVMAWIGRRIEMYEQLMEQIK